MAFLETKKPSSFEQQTDSVSRIGLNNQRILWPDALKTVACFAVVMWHVSAVSWYETGLSSPGDYFSYVVNMMVRFSVPCFLMISGYFLLDQSKPLSFKKLYSHYVFRVFLIIIVTSTLWFVFENVLGVIEVTSIGDMLRSIIAGPYHIWYLWALIAVYIFLPILRLIAGNRTILNYTILAFLVLCFFHASLKHVLSAGFSFPGISIAMLFFNQLTTFATLSFPVGYALIGYYLASTELSAKKRQLLYFMGLVCLLVSLGAGVCSYNQTGLKSLEIGSNASVTTLIFASAVFLFFKNRKLEVSGIRKGITAIAPYTFLVYLIHVFILEGFLRVTDFVSWLQTNPFFFIPLATLGIFFLSLGFAIILKKVFPPLRKWV